MDWTTKHFQQNLENLEWEGEQLLLARHQMIENDKSRNANREALTALRRRARTTKCTVPSRSTSKSDLVKELCSTCGNHDPDERTWFMFPGADVFARVPFHLAHSLVESNEEQLGDEAKILQSLVKEKSLVISERGAIADKINPGTLNSLVKLTDKSK